MNPSALAGSHMCRQRGFQPAEKALRQQNAGAGNWVGKAGTMGPGRSQHLLHRPKNNKELGSVQISPSIA